MNSLASAYRFSTSKGLLPQYSMNRAAMLSFALVIAQILDGILTASGLAIFGVEGEGNAILRNLMEFYGIIPTLFVIKLLAIFTIGFLYQHHKDIPWIEKALTALVTIYSCFALVPWTVIITTNLLA